MDYNGNLAEDLDFTMNNGTEVFASCSAQLNGEYYIMGGSIETYQISKIADCQVERIGDLPFTFYGGTCATYHVPYERIFMCFSSGGYDKCRRYYIFVVLPSSCSST